MWKITFCHGSILGLTVLNIKSKINFFQKSLILSVEDIKKVITRLPSLLSLTPKNIQPKSDLLRQTLGMRTSELQEIVLRYPCILTYSMSNTYQKIKFFTEYLNCTTVQNRRLLNLKWSRSQMTDMPDSYNNL